jgi:8-oxo-dGTP pyrophosphatase MutT (NUDIX family)
MDVKPSVGILVIQNDSVLLVKHGPGSMHIVSDYGLPSGKVMENETEKQAAVRELFEETGFRATEDDLSEFQGNYFSAHLKLNDGSNHLWGWRVFLCKKYSGSLRTTSETEPMWLKINKLANLSPKMPNVIDAVKAGLKFLNLK